MIHLVLYQPDIPQNLGACLRLSACMGCTVHVVEPCGFPFDHAKLRRAGMDYIDKAKYFRHLNWDTFLKYRQAQDQARVGSHPEPRSEGVSEAKGSSSPSRLLLLETDGKSRYTDFAFTSNDYVVIGSEGAGTPRELYPQMDATLTIPMREGVRSLNMAMSAGMLVAEACRQRNWSFNSSLRAKRGNPS